MYSYDAERVVCADPSAVSGAIGELVATLWGRASRLIDDDGLRRIDAVAGSDLEEAADVWLTWQLTPESGATRVRLVLDELDPGPEPIEELGAVLDMLVERVGVAS
jgi:hypothetical protein